ncbi:NUDIX hydrolase [Brevibacillus nitrificans]|uniref:NUDIX hydrolase n=1 Tax=Brevibacillus nitrificans TaxID=651560 RepID=UPI00261B549F|nr:NUDIX hydrolase [Brevibacillus nitrificans]
MIDYVKEMRKVVGTSPLLLCGASVIIFNKDKKVLMLHRSDNDCWCFPGGTIDLGESLEQTARREVLEETNLTIIDLQLFSVFSGKELHYIYPHGDEVYAVDTVYISTTYEGEIVINNESKDFGFFDINDLPSNINPPTIPVTRELKRQFGANSKFSC